MAAPEQGIAIGANSTPTWTGKRDDRLQCRGLTDLVNGQPGVLQTKDESRDYRWGFAHGKLCELNITQRGSLNTEREIGLLIEKYGQPSERRTVVLQNAYGAKWECPEVSWSMPDGTFIQAGEYIDADYYGAPQRRIMITFMSKDAIADAQRKGSPSLTPTERRNRRGAANPEALKTLPHMWSSRRP
jgi:hypothetical protein